MNIEAIKKKNGEGENRDERQVKTYEALEI